MTMGPTELSTFTEIRDECVEKQKQWEDPDFPPVQSSVFYHQTPPFTFEWKRPPVKKVTLWFC